MLASLKTVSKNQQQQRQENATNIIIQGEFVSNYKLPAAHPDFARLGIGIYTKKIL